jgi:hypothetical protein
MYDGIFRKKDTTMLPTLTVYLIVKNIELVKKNFIGVLRGFQPVLPATARMLGYEMSQRTPGVTHIPAFLDPNMAILSALKKRSACGDSASLVDEIYIAQTTVPSAQIDAACTLTQQWKEAKDCDPLRHKIEGSANANNRGLADAITPETKIVSSILKPATGDEFPVFALHEWSHVHGLRELAGVVPGGKEIYKPFVGEDNGGSTGAENFPPVRPKGRV